MFINCEDTVKTTKAEQFWGICVGKNFKDGITSSRRNPNSWNADLQSAPALGHTIESQALGYSWCLVEVVRYGKWLFISAANAWQKPFWPSENNCKKQSPKSSGLFL